MVGRLKCLSGDDGGGANRLLDNPACIGMTSCKIKVHQKQAFGPGPDMFTLTSISDVGDELKHHVSCCIITGEEP